MTDSLIPAYFEGFLLLSIQMFPFITARGPVSSSECQLMTDKNELGSEQLHVYLFGQHLCLSVLQQTF